MHTKTTVCSTSKTHGFKSDGDVIHVNELVIFRKYTDRSFGLFLIPPCIYALQALELVIFQRLQARPNLLLAILVED